MGVSVGGSTGVGVAGTGVVNDTGVLPLGLGKTGVGIDGIIRSVSIVVDGGGGGGIV